MVNTILSDDEIDKAWNDRMGTPEYSRQDVGRAIEAAVLAKLREQPPVTWLVKTYEGGHERFEDSYCGQRGSFPVFATPLPAVVQVPPGYKLVPVEPTRDMLKAGTNARTPFRGMHHMQSEAVFKAMLAAAPEAPAQAVSEREAFDEAWAARVLGIPFGDALGLHEFSDYQKQRIACVLRGARAALTQQPAAQEKQ